MIAFVSLSGVGSGVGDGVDVGVGWLAFPDFVRAVPAADEFFDARDVDDAVVEVADEFGHFLDQEHFVGMHCVAGKTRAVGGGDAVADVGQNRSADRGVWKRRRCRKTR